MLTGRRIRERQALEAAGLTQPDAAPALPSVDELQREIDHRTRRIADLKRQIAELEGKPGQMPTALENEVEREEDALSDARQKLDHVKSPPAPKPAEQTAPPVVPAASLPQSPEAELDRFTGEKGSVKMEHMEALEHAAGVATPNPSAPEPSAPVEPKKPPYDPIHQNPMENPPKASSSGPDLAKPKPPAKPKP